MVTNGVAFYHQFAPFGDLNITAIYRGDANLAISPAQVMFDSACTAEHYRFFNNT